MPTSGPSRADDRHAPLITRRGLLGLGIGGALTLLAGGSLRALAYSRLRWSEDVLPGDPPDLVLDPQAWTTTADAIRFAVIGDTGSGGRNQMAVAAQMARTYRDEPYGLVLHAGDVSYYGSLDDRWDEVVVAPYGPLMEAGVGWELAIGNHEISESKSPDAEAEIEAQLRRFGKPGPYYRVTHGPVDVFVIDSSTPLAMGEVPEAQLQWLAAELPTSDAPWKVALLHHPGYSSGEHGSDLRVRDALEPLFVEHRVDVVFTGHDHHYERTTPQRGVTWVVSGAGCKLTGCSRSDFTAHAESTLQFVLVDVDGDRMRLRAITTDGTVIDQAEIVHRSAS